MAQHIILITINLLVCVWCVAGVHGMTEALGNGPQTHGSRLETGSASSRLETGSDSYDVRAKNHKFLKGYEEQLVDGETKLAKATVAAQKGLQNALNFAKPTDMLQARIHGLVTAQKVASGVQAVRSHCEWCANRV